MLPIIAAVIVITTTGWASQYAEGVMPRVVAYQQRRGKLPADVASYDGFVAAQSCDDIGLTMWLRPENPRRWEKFLVADCAGPHLRPDGLTGYEWMRVHNILVEVDYETATRWDTVGRGMRVEMARARPMPDWYVRKLERLE